MSYSELEMIWLFWSLDYTKDTHGWYAEAFKLHYRADAGFTRRTNTNGIFAYRESTKSKPKATLIRLLNQFVRYTITGAGRNTHLLVQVLMDSSRKSLLQL
jgi:hypothetical protein